VKLPGADHAIVDEVKVRDYLLSAAHPVGRAKARFFTSLGFRRERSGELRDALLALARRGQVTLGAPTIFGQKYVVRDIIQGPAGLTAALTTVWIVRQGEDFARFITAYPGDSE
jgi:hypothetical protein